MAKETKVIHVHLIFKKTSRFFGSISAIYLNGAYSLCFKPKNRSNIQSFLRLFNLSLIVSPIYSTVHRNEYRSNGSKIEGTELFVFFPNILRDIRQSPMYRRFHVLRLTFHSCHILY